MTIRGIVWICCRLSRTDKNLNSGTAKDSQGLVRTCQVLDQFLHVSLLALQVLD